MNNDWRDYLTKKNERDYLAHSWGKKPEQKAAEKAYNAKYYQEHKEKWKKLKENVTDALGGKEKKEAQRAEADYVHKTNEWDRSVALDARYADDNSYDKRLRSYKEWDKAGWNYQQALLRYKDTPMGRVEQSSAVVKSLFTGKKYKSWADQKYKAVSPDAMHEHTKQNLLWKGDHRYSDWHDDKGDVLKKPKR